MATQTEEKNLKDEKYSEPSKQEDALAGKKKVCGIESIPGLEFKTKQVLAHCNTCNSDALTNVETVWSIKNYLCCYYCGCYWTCRQNIKGKDITLKNAVHKCGSCSTELANYDAC